MGRRGHGEGSIYKRADGYWTAVIDLGWEDGKRKRKQLYGKTRKEVADKLSEAQQLHRGGRLPTAPGQTLEKYLATWLEDVKPSLRPKTYDDYSRMTQKHIVPGLGKVQLAKLTPGQVQRFYTKKLETLSPRSVEYLHAILHRSLERAERWGLVPRNPADSALVDVPRPRKHEFTPLTFDEAKAFLAVAAEHRLSALWALALHTGMRQGEILGLRWKDLEDDCSALTVNQTIQRVGKALVVGEPKTEGSRRRVPIPPSVAAELNRWRTTQKAELLALGVRWSPEGYVFTSEAGTPIFARKLLDQFKRLLVKAATKDDAGRLASLEGELAEATREHGDGSVEADRIRASAMRLREEIERKTERAQAIRFHDLRHSAASLMLAEGVPPKVVQEMLGHSQISMTMDTYGHLMPGQREQAVSALARALAAG